MKFLFFPLNSPGHVNSSLGIADRLRQKGHETVFMTLGPMMDPETVVKRCHETIVVEDKCPLPNGVPGSTNKWPSIIEKCKKYFQSSPLDGLLKSHPLAEDEMKREIRVNNEQYKEIIDNIQPDVILVDAYFIPPCVVTSNIPWCRLFSANPMGLGPPCVSIPPSQSGFSIPRDIIELAMAGKYDQIERPSEWIEWDRAVEEALGTKITDWNDYLVSHGCEPLFPGKQAHDSPSLNIYMFPEAVDYHKIRPDFPRWVRCDSLLRLPVDSWSLPESIDSKSDLGGLIYFSMGSLASSDAALMKRLVGFLAHSKNRFIVSKGTNGDQYELPDNMWGENYVPQDLILGKVDMAITHGGNNSLTECFYFGCPMIVMPIFSDQLDNAQRVEDLGYGIRLNAYNCTQEELLKAIDSIMSNDELRQIVRKVGDKMRRTDDASRVCGLLESLGQEKKLSQEAIDHFKST